MRASDSCPSLLAVNHHFEAEVTATDTVGVDSYFHAERLAGNACCEFAAMAHVENPYALPGCGNVFFPCSDILGDSEVVGAEAAAAGCFLGVETVYIVVDHTRFMVKWGAMSPIEPLIYWIHLGE